MEKEQARAPYNFIQLNDIIVPSKVNEYIEKLYLRNKNNINYSNKKNRKMLNEAGYKAFIKDGIKYNGYFDVDIENITPLYFGGENGLSVDGIHKAIPGSSLRGCLKNVFKIITNSAMRCNENGSISDGLLFWRDISKGGLFTESYLKEMTLKNKEITAPRAQAGFLVEFRGSKYICPAKFKVMKNTTNIKEIKKSPHVIWENNYVDVFSGNIDKKNKTYFYRITEPIWDKRIEISNEFMKFYKLDRNRNSKNLLKKDAIKKPLKKIKLIEDAMKKGCKNIVPCFYCIKNGKVCHLGSSPYYRIPYRKKIYMHVPKELNLSKIDFTEAVFGNKEFWSSRIYVEDCYLKEEQEDAFYKKSVYLRLNNPNLAAYQFYLDTGSDGEVQDWNGNTSIRGYKMYWHKKMEWKKNLQDNISKQLKKDFIQPLKEHCHFKGKVRFENLDEIELGALVYLFKLGEENCCYKLGMGKPMGLGSVKIIANLYLRDEKYYKKLFDKDDKFKGYNLEKDKQRYVEAFSQYMYNNLLEHSEKSLELYQKRMRDLKLIMGIENINDVKWSNKVSYMDIENDDDKEILKRKIPLPTIDKVVENT